MAPSTQGASTPVSAFPGLDLSNEIIVCTPYSDIAEYQGTRAALEAEGVIPAGTVWPEGFNDLHWENSRFRYRLRRKRPAAAKGARKQFLTVDWWMFRCDPLAGESIETLNIKHKAKELADAIHRASAKGRAEWYAHWNRYWQAQHDKPFQAFKTRLGLVEKKRGRPCKNRGQAKGAAA